MLVPVLVLAIGVPAGAARTSSEERPALSATVSQCLTGSTPADRLAVFTGSMPAVPGSAWMAMRFDLEERDGDSGRFRRLLVAGFGGWERSQHNVAGFVYDKRVEMLQAPAAYRVTVRFRWFDAKGKIVRRAQRVSAQCRQPPPR